MIKYYLIANFITSHGASNTCDAILSGNKYKEDLLIETNFDPFSFHEQLSSTALLTIEIQ